MDKKQSNKIEHIATKPAGIVIRTDIKAGGTFLEDVKSLFSQSSTTPSCPTQT